MVVKPPPPDAPEGADGVAGVVPGLTVTTAVGDCVGPFYDADVKRQSYIMFRVFFVERKAIGL